MPKHCLSFAGSFWTYLCSDPTIHINFKFRYSPFRNVKQQQVDKSGEIRLTHSGRRRSHEDNKYPVPPEDIDLANGKLRHHGRQRVETEAKGRCQFIAVQQSGSLGMSAEDLRDLVCIGSEF